MKKFNLFSVFIVVFVLVLTVSSCAKETKEVKLDLMNANESEVEARSSNSACSPQSLFTEYSSCTNQTKTVPISFALGYGLYDTNSTLYSLCPGIIINVTYTYTKCIIGALGAEVHFVHNLSYDLSAIVAACPALQAEIAYQNSIGNLISFLDLLDDDISRQVEFTEAYNTALNSNPNKYLCSPNNGVFYSIKYIKNTCYFWDVQYNPELGKWLFVKEDCGGTVCCARSNSYCVLSWENGEPNLLIGQSTTYQKFEGNCPEECGHDCGVEPGQG